VIIPKRRSEPRRLSNGAPATSVPLRAPEPSVRFGWRSRWRAAPGRRPSPEPHAARGSR